MDLYVDPIATTSRAVLAFCVAEKLPAAIHHVSLMKGEHREPRFAAINPSCMVPVLVDGDFVLTESATILRYLARKHESRLYPTNLRDASRVDEIMTWVGTNLYKDLGFQYVLPQVFPHHRRATEEANRITIEWGRDLTRRWLRVLDEHFLGPEKTHLAGDALTIADLYAAAVVSVGELVGCSYAEFPNVRRWYAATTALPAWREVDGGFRAFVESVRGRSFVGLS